MGWGCNKHHCDAGSRDWVAKLNELGEREETRGFPTWGRQVDSDGMVQICPWCYEEMETTLRKLANIPIRGYGLADDYGDDRAIVNEHNTGIIDLIREAREILDVGEERGTK